MANDGLQVQSNSPSNDGALTGCLSLKLCCLSGANGAAGKDSPVTQIMNEIMSKAMKRLNNYRAEVEGDSPQHCVSFVMDHRCAHRRQLAVA